ncbi:hypothetical protein JTE90_021614 [Oedothorax gibbosus]|uniref:Uncharacterized protein n=1 Tax=Oedothorax gibbosus TaxID=931172 RepID=A0AAV6VNW4_9ARAC|nr:hypothetical protein JTE90_021614 [Oedothorax gibbosus]
MRTCERNRSSLSFSSLPYSLSITPKSSEKIGRGKGNPDEKEMENYRIPASFSLANRSIGKPDLLISLFSA